MGRLKEFFTKEKIQAFSIHLGISLLIFFIILYFILVEWYPQPLFSTDGGWQGIQIIAFVDIVLGPFLTLVIFKKGKPRLKMDLTIIAVIQFSALISGIVVVYNEHPVAVIAMESRLNPITAYKLKEAGIELSSLKQYSDLHPPLIYLNLPEDRDAFYEVLKKSIRQGQSLRLLGDLYEKLTEKNKSRLRKDALVMEVYLKEKPKEKIIYQKFLNQNKFKNHTLLYFPLYSRYKYGVAVLDNDTFEMLIILDIDPGDLKDVYE